MKPVIADWKFDEFEFVMFLQRFSSYDDLQGFLKQRSELKDDKNVIFRLRELANAEQSILSKYVSTIILTLLKSNCYT